MRLLYCALLTVGIISCSGPPEANSKSFEEVESFTEEYYRAIFTADFKDLESFYDERFFEYSTKEELLDLLDKHYEKVGEFEDVEIHEISNQQVGYLVPYNQYVITSTVYYEYWNTEDSLDINEYEEGKYEVFKWILRW